MAEDYIGGEATMGEKNGEVRERMVKESKLEDTIRLEQLVYYCQVRYSA